MYIAKGSSVLTVSLRGEEAAGEYRRFVARSNNWPSTSTPETPMVEKRLLCPHRRRRTPNHFSWLYHRLHENVRVGHMPGWKVGPGAHQKVLRWEEYREHARTGDYTRSVIFGSRS